MQIRGTDVALSLLAAGTAVAAGYAFRASRRKSVDETSTADVGARIVEEIPDGATVVDASSERLREIPGVQRAIKRAVINDAREEWEHVTFERTGAWRIVDHVRRRLPYYDGTDSDSEYNGVYVQYDDRVVVLDAIGWAHIDEPRQDR